MAGGIRGSKILEWSVGLCVMGRSIEGGLGEFFCVFILLILITSSRSTRRMRRRISRIRVRYRNSSRDRLLDALTRVMLYLRRRLSLLAIPNYRARRSNCAHVTRSMFGSKALRRRVGCNNGGRAGRHRGRGLTRENRVLLNDMSMRNRHSRYTNNCRRRLNGTNRYVCYGCQE